MKKILSCFVALFAAVSLYATDLNIYASGLKVTTSGGTTAGIQYTLNAPATSLNLKILDGSTLVTTIAIPAGDANVNFTKGTHNVNIDITDLAEGSYNWALVASAAANDAVTKVDPEFTHTYTFFRGLDVDKDPESPSFGNIYVADAIGAVANGLVGFYPASMDSRTSFSIDFSGWSPKNMAPLRVTVGEDHLLYITDWSDVYPNVFVVNPEVPAADAQKVFGGTKSGTNGIYVDDEGNQIHGSISHCYVAGTGENRVLYIFDEDVTENVTHAKSLLKYNIGENTPWNAAPSSVIYANPDNYEQNGNSMIWPDGKGGWWISQHRAADQAAIPMLIHIDNTGTVNFRSSASGLSFGTYNQGALALNKDKTQLATATTGGIIVWDISWNEDVPTLAQAYTISTIAGNTTCYSIAFDYAGNIYAGYNDNDIYVYAPVKADNSCETPAPSTSMIVRSSTITHVTGISLDQTSASIEKGHTLTLVPTITPNDASNPTVIWTSANSDVASVSNTGVVTAVAEGGPITITATTQDGGFTATCEVTVFMNHVTSVTIEPSEIALGVGFKQQLTATILPADATNKTYTWSSDDESIATVANGMVTAVALGSTTIKATAEDGGIVGSCTVNVTPAVAHIGAYGLSVVKNANDYTFSFNATMAATSGALEFYNEAGSKVGEIALASVVAGANQKTVTFAEIPGAPAQELTWGVRLSAADNAAFSKIYQASNVTGRGHVVVDASPESNYFGQIYYTNRTAAAGTSGLYVFDQMFNRSELHKLGESVTQGFTRSCIDENGLVWIADWTDGHSGIWIVDPSDLNSISQFFQGTRQGSGLIKNGNVEVGGSSPACFIYGKGENKKLFTIQEDFTTLTGQPMAVYNIGNDLTRSEAPDQLFSVGPNTDFSNALYVVEEGFWLSRYRGAGQNTEAYPALQFYTWNGDLLYTSAGNPQINGSCSGGMTVDTKHNKLYLVDASSYILEFNIEYNAETHVPTLTLVDKHYIGFAAIASMSMDYAGNLYVTAADNASINNAATMRMVVYSPATNGDNTTITPAPKAATVSTPDVETLYMIGVDNWNPTVGTVMEKVSDNVFRCQVDFNATKYFAFSTVLADNNDEGGWAYVKAHRYAGTVADATLVPGEEMALVYGVDRSMQMTAGKYNITVDLNTMKVSAIAVVDQLFEIGDNQGWELTGKVAMTKVSDNVFEAELTFTAPISYFAFTTSESTDWDVVNAARYASDVYQERVDDESEVNLTAGDGNATLTILPGVYTIRVDFNTNKITVTQSVAKVSFDSEIGYATYYNSRKGYTMPTNVTGYAFNYPGAGLTQAFTAGDDVPAGVALVLEGPAGTFDLVLKTGVPAVDLANQLRGTDADELTTAPGEGVYLFYGLSLAQPEPGLLPDPKTVGFYWMAEDGAAFTNKAHKAYLALPENILAPSRILFQENDATGIENVEGQEKAVKFIENGQIFIRKDGVVYDAMGRVIR